MGQGQTREELRDAVQNELGAYFVSALPPSSVSQDINQSSSCTALIENSQLEKWLSSPGRASTATAGNGPQTGHTPHLDDISQLWTHTINEMAVRNTEENSATSSGSSASQSPSSDSQALPTSSKLHEFMIGASQLDMSRPVVVHVVKKSSPSSFTFQQPPSTPLSETNEQQNASSSHTASSWTHGETPRGTAPHSRQPSSTSTSLSAAERFDLTTDVTVIEYLAELEKDFTRIGNKEDKCRFFSVPSQSTSEGTTDKEENEADIINEWYSKSLVAILSGAEIASINEAHQKSRPSRHQTDPSAELKSPRGQPDETEKVGGANPIIPPLDLMRPSAHSSAGKPEFVSTLRGVVTLEKSTASEVKALAKPHPNLLIPLKIVEGPEHIFLLFPYHRYSLESVFRFSPGVLDNEAKKMFFAYQLLRTLQWLHDSDMVHGDLRPHNLKMTERFWLTLSGGLYSPEGDKSLSGDSLHLGGSKSKDGTTSRDTAISSRDEMVAMKDDTNSESASTRPSSRRSSVKQGDNSLAMKLRANSGLVPQTKANESEPPRIPNLILQPLSIDRTTATSDWVEGRMSNFEYIMKLNEWSGRRTGDPNFHPVMPWVIDFTTPQAWRDLTKTKFRLNKGDEQLDFTYANPIPAGSKGRGESATPRQSFGPRSEQTSQPYHINDTLSELTYYNYFARRTPLCLLRKYVRTNFVAAEYPSTMERLYQWSPDECIPEFFADPSIFESLNPELPDLAVPSWAENVSKFLALHREALESEQVSRYLHHWIDLTFGHKLSGEAGKQAKNVALMDRNTLRNHGFVQLFLMPHPPRRRTATIISTWGQASKSAITWTIPATSTETVAAIPLVSAPSTALIGSASGISSSFTSSAPTSEAYGSQATARDRRKSVRIPNSAASVTPSTAATSTAATGSASQPNVFALLPKITINKPTPTQGASGDKPAPGPQSPVTTPHISHGTQTASSNPADHAEGAAPEPVDENSKGMKPHLQRHTSLDSNPVPAPQHPEKPPHLLQRSASDLTSADFTTQQKTSISGFSAAKSSDDSGSPHQTHQTHGHSADSPGHASSISPPAIGRVLESDLTLSLHREQYGSGSSFSDDPESMSSATNAMFRFSGEHPMTSSPTPSVSSPSTSPLCDDLETYQSMSNQQRNEGHAIQSVSTPTSINPLLEPSTTPKATGKSLSNSTGVSMESPTRQTPPTRTSLGPVPTGAAVVPPITQGAPRTPTTSSGSPKDRSDKEKEKTSFRREFMKIFGTISDAVSLDKKPSDKAAQLQSATSPVGTPPPANQHYYPVGDSKSDPKKVAILHKSASYVEHSTPPSNMGSMNYGSASASPYASSRDLSSSMTMPNLSDSMGADTSTSAEEQIGSFRLPGSVPTDENSPLLNATTTAATPARPAPKMVTYYVEDLSNGEYQSRFMMQVSLLEPIFTAPFADLELSPTYDASLSPTERHRLLLDRAKCADLFSAGCIIYQLLSGMPLFHKDNIIQYLQGDGTWWWGTASQAIPRRFKALVFELVLAGRPYFLYALQSGVSLGYVSRAMTGTTSTEPIEFEAPEDPFDFGVASVAPTPVSTSNTSVPNTSSPSAPMTSAQELGHLSNNILARFLNDDLISSPTSMKVFPSYFEQVYQFLARYHSTPSNKNRIKLATDNVGFLVNLPMSGLELILPDILVFFDIPDTAIEALALIEPLAIKLGRILTISKLLGPILGLYERMQQVQQGTQGTSSSIGATSTSTAANYEKAPPSRHLELALELLSPRFVNTLLAKLGQSCFLKHIVGFLVNEIRSTKKEMSFAAGSAILRLVSVLSPPIFIRYILYPLLAQLNKANTEVLNATLVEIGARMGEDVVVRHHMEVIIPLLQTTIFNKDAISIRTSTSLLKLISSLVAIIHPNKIVNSVMVDHRCMFSILLTPPTHDKHLAEALLDCLTSIYASMGLHLAIKYARPYIQQFFTIFSNTPAGHLASGENPETDPKSIYYPTVLARFKDLLEVRSGGGNVSIQHALGPATRIESYLMGPVAAVPHVPSITASLEDDHSHTSASHHNTGVGQQTGTNISATATSPQAPQPRHLGMEKSPSQNSIPDSTNDSVTTSGSSKSLQVPDLSAEAAPTSAVIAPRRLSSPVRPISPTLSVLATPPVPEAKEAPAAILRLTTMNEDGYVADHMPNWLASMQGVPYTPAPVVTVESRNSSVRPVTTMGVSSGGMSSSTTSTGPNGLGSGSGTSASASTTSGGDKSGAKKPTLMGPSSASTGMGGVGATSSTSAWDSSRDFEAQSVPFVLNTFGPPTPSTHGAGWPPALGPQQSWNFSGQVGHTFKEHSNAIRCVFVHDNERLFLTGSKDTTVKCWDMLSEGSSRQTYTGHRLAVTHAEFVDRGNLVASCDGSVHVWELERGTKLANMEAAFVSSYASNSSRDRDSSSPTTSFTCFSSHQDGRVLVCGTSLSTITFTDLRAEQEVVCEWYLPTATAISSTSPGSVSGSGSTSNTASTSAQSFPRSISLGHLDQNLIVVGQSSGHITLIDIRSGLLLHNWRAHDAPITSLKSVPECPGYFVSASLDKTMALWDISNASKVSPAILTHFKGHSDPHISFDIFKGTLYSVSGQKISIAPLFGQASTVTLEKRKLVKTNALKLTNYLTSFNVLQSQHLALVGADDGTIKVLQ